MIDYSYIVVNHFRRLVETPIHIMGLYSAIHRRLLYHENKECSTFKLGIIARKKEMLYN